MSYIHVSKVDMIATVTLSRGKVNALNEPVVEELTQAFQNLEDDDTVNSVILTGSGKFFSFGFDVPELLNYPKSDFIRFLEKFANFYSYLFLFPKPIIAALNGHAIAGGCMLATACDLRLMVSGKAKISLNEITFGAPVPAGSVEMLIYCVGTRNAQSVLYSGSMYSAEEAFQLGLVDQVSTEGALAEDARRIAQELAQKDNSAFRTIKHLLRNPVAERMIKREKDAILKFVDIWYSEQTWENLKEITIHE